MLFDEVINAEREGLAHLSPAEQCRALHIYPGHVLERVRDGRLPTWVNEAYAQRITLLWLGERMAVWSSQTMRTPRHTWSTAEETEDVDLRDDWLRVDRGAALPRFAWSGGYGMPTQTDSFAHVGRILVWVRQDAAGGPWVLDSVPFFVSRRLWAQSLHDAQREAEELVRAALYETLRSAGVDIGGPEDIADAEAAPSDQSMRMVEMAA